MESGYPGQQSKPGIQRQTDKCLKSPWVSGGQLVLPLKYQRHLPGQLMRRPGWNVQSETRGGLLRCDDSLKWGHRVGRTQGAGWRPGPASEGVSQSPSLPGRFLLIFKFSSSERSSQIPPLRRIRIPLV